MSQLQSFTLFPNIPLELRRQIYNEAIGSPRVIKVKQQIVPQFQNSRAARCTEPRCAARPKKIGFRHSAIAENPLPAALLRVCKESAEEAKKRLLTYIRFYRTGQKIFFNPERDTIYFDSESTMNLILASTGPTAQFRYLKNYDLIKNVAFDQLMVAMQRIPSLKRGIFHGVTSIQPYYHDDLFVGHFTGFAIASMSAYFEHKDLFERYKREFKDKVQANARYGRAWADAADAAYHLLDRNVLNATRDDWAQGERERLLLLNKPVPDLLF